MPHTPGEHEAGGMSSTRPLQSLSTPSQTSAVGVCAVALHTVPPERFTTVTALRWSVVVPSPSWP